MPYIGNPQVGFISADTLAVSGTVDGRDVSVDGTKLDTIETSATADQTNAEIRAAVEAASDSNVFTDADHTKLNGIEASATADQTASEIRTLVESASDSNVFTDADHSKLNAIEASADVTDATNVAAAGAAMLSGATFTGNVGVGASPTLDGSLAGLSVNSSGTVLHVNDGDGASLKLTDPATGANRGLGITLQGTSAAISNCESGELRFGTGNAERMRLDSSGNVGIGNTGNSNYKLAANGGIAVGTGSGSVAAGELFAMSDGTNFGKITIGSGPLFQVGTRTSFPMAFFVANSEKMRIDTSGNVGIGVTPSHKLHVFEGARNGGYAINGSYDALVVEGTQHVGISIAGGSNNSGSAAIAFPNGSSNIDGLINYNHGGRYLAFHVGGSERARFEANGDFLVGMTTSGFSQIGCELNAIGYVLADRDGGAAAFFNRRSSDGPIIALYRQNSQVGTIQVSTSGTTYHTTSDIRLKQDIEPLEATDKLMAMNPVSFSWKADPDGARSMGFIAQEMEEIVPDAVSIGEDDDAMLSMDYGRITPVLVSALQDAHRKIEQLEQRLANMEAN